MGPISYKDPDSIRRDAANLKAALATVTVEEGFLTAVAPASVGYDAFQEYYANDRDYVFAIAGALREESLAVYNAGLVLQVDDAVLPNMYNKLVQQSPAHYRRWAEVRVEALNHALGRDSGRPRPVSRLLRQLACPARRGRAARGDRGSGPPGQRRRVLIEAANVRHEHESQVQRRSELPEGKILMPGVVTHHTTTVEHPRLVADRIVRFAKLVGRENVVASTDCGFAQVETLARVHPQVMWAKFESLAEGARLASAELWGR